jgi:putative membrane protein
MMWSWNDSGWAWFWMATMMVVFWAIVVAAIVLVVRALRSPQGGGIPAARTPQDILAERYARGEIDADEYRRRVDELKAHAAQ